MKTNLAAILRTDKRVEEVDWREIYEQFLPRVFHFVCYRVGHIQLAEDLTATTFEKAWASRGNFRKNHGEVQAWLMGIAHHVACDYFRKPHREVAFTEAINVPDTSLVDETVQRQLDFERLSALLAKVSDREREIVALKYGAEMTNREIARFTGLSESNVGTIIHRMVNKLRLEWEEKK